MSDVTHTEQADRAEDAGGIERSDAPEYRGFVDTRAAARAARAAGTAGGAEAALRADLTRSLVGRGLEFPLGVDEAGNLALSSGDDVSAAVYMILMTAPGERVMRPEFGCDIWDHVYSPINAATLGQMAHAVRVALSRWEPRIVVDEVRVTPEESTMAPERHSSSVVRIEIDYRLRSTNDWRNLVYPFYVIPESEST